VIRSLAVLLLLAGCAGYEPSHGAYYIRVGSLDYIQAFHRRTGGGGEVGAFTILGTDPCRIFIAAKHFNYLIEHEMRHCPWAEGDFHE